MKKINLIILLFFILFLSGCRLFDFYDENYEGFYTTKIPTNSTLRGTIKIPNEWEFIIDDGIITLINKDTKEVIAEQIVQGYVSSIYKNNDWLYIGNDLSFNNKYEVEYAIKVNENYDRVKIYSNSIEKYIFSDDKELFCVLKINAYINREKGDYILLLRLYDEQYEDVIEKIINSYCFGGTLGYENDVIYD